MTITAATALQDLSQTDRILSMLVYLENVLVVFDGFRALDIDVFGLYHNELRVVIGPNGAGKTTLCDVISGKTRASAGKVYLNGTDVTSASETEIARRGVGRKFQTPTVFDSLTVFENVELALPRRRRLWQNLWGRTTSDEHDQIQSILKRMRLSDEIHKPAKFLSHGQRQCLEISMLIVASPQLLLVMSRQPD